MIADRRIYAIYVTNSNLARDNIDQAKYIF